MAAEKHADFAEPLEAWFHAAEKAYWSSIVDVRATYPQADAVGECTVFNIKGNKYRLIVKINYRKQMVFIKAVLTHAEYSKDGWQDECNCN